LPEPRKNKSAPPDIKHKAFLQFIRRIVDVPLGYSKDDLRAFRRMINRDYAALVGVVDEYLQLAENADSVVSPLSHSKLLFPSGWTHDNAEQMHLFDLFRDKRLFSSNSELSEFAGRILPKMVRRRFDKMSRGEISAKIIEYLETLDVGTRKDLEQSMRSALTSESDSTSDRKTFFSRWEQIIKGTPS